MLDRFLFLHNCNDGESGDTGPLLVVPELRNADASPNFSKSDDSSAPDSSTTLTPAQSLLYFLPSVVFCRAIMFRSAPRIIARQGALRAAPRASLPARRFISTAPPAQKSRSWKSLVARLGLAGAIIYYYNTTDVFADEPRGMPRITARAAVNGC